MVDDQQHGTNKQGLTPSPSNTNADSTNGMKLLMVPGQAQMSSFSLGK